QVRVREQKFRPLDKAKMPLTVQWVNGSAPSSPSPPSGERGGVRGPSLDPGATNISRLTAEQSLADPGVYLASYVPPQPGGYFASAQVNDAAGVDVGHASAGWSADPAAEEFKSLKPNKALMELIAKKTGGEMISASKL